MKRLALVAPLALSFCATMPPVSCDSAARVRTAATLALAALDRVCPMDIR